VKRLLAVEEAHTNDDARPQLPESIPDVQGSVSNSTHRYVEVFSMYNTPGIHLLFMPSICVACSSDVAQTIITNRNLPQGIITNRNLPQGRINGTCG